jgi:hypothetical protein
MKVKTDIIFSRSVSLIGCVVILVIMYVETFKTDVIVFVCNVYNVFKVTLTDNFQYQSQSNSVDTDTISPQ